MSEPERSLSTAGAESPDAVSRRRSRWVDAAIAGGVLVWFMFVTDRRPSATGAWEAPRGGSSAWSAPSDTDAQSAGPDAWGEGLGASMGEIESHHGAEYSGILIEVDLP